MSLIQFARLFRELDQTKSIHQKREALTQFFASAPSEDAAWAMHFLIGNKQRRIVPSRVLRRWACLKADIPDWLFEETYQWVGDLAETISLVVPDSDSIGVDLPVADQSVADRSAADQSAADQSAASRPVADRSLAFASGCDGSTQATLYDRATPPGRATLSEWVRESLLPLQKLDEPSCLLRLDAILGRVGGKVRFVLVKLMTGAFRVGVSRGLITQSLAMATKVERSVIAHRLMGSWEPSPEFIKSLTQDPESSLAVSSPYPFCLAHGTNLHELSSNGFDPRQYLAEWKWDGIRAQIIKRRSQLCIWSRGEERIEHQFPELLEAASNLPDGVVLDGEILAWDSETDSGPLPFQQLQRRLGRKKPGKKILKDVPVAFVAFDLLELDYSDLRSEELSLRRSQLEQILQDFPNTHVRPSEVLAADCLDQLVVLRDTAREKSAEGLMLKRLDSAYRDGRVTNVWWKWKLDPYSVDAVLIYAQRGHGRRANLYSDYTFAVWHEGKLVPFAKAYSGLDDREMQEVDRFIRQNTHEKFGPVRSVTPALVFEIAFEGIQRSPRHKSGIAVRFPRILRWRKDKSPDQADQLESLQRMIL